MTAALRPAGVRRRVLAGALCALVLGGCATTVTGSGEASVSPSGSSSPDFPSASTSTSPSTRFPRTPLSTSIGDPATADLCAAIPLSSFTGLGYTPVYSTVVFPPGCSVRMNTGSDTKFSVYVYGVGPSNFSHLDTGGSSKPQRTSTIAGLTVNFYPFDKTLGNCQRDVEADGLTLRIAVLSRAGSGKADKAADCAGADAMTKVVAQAAAARSVPRLKLSTPSITKIDFCAALRATKVSDLPGYADGEISNDGVGDGCQLVRDAEFYFYVDFSIGNARQPDSTKPTTVGGHLLYAADSNDSSYCDLTSTQGTTTAGRFEQIEITASDYSSGNKGDLCDDATTVAARFLDTAGLT